MKLSDTIKSALYDLFDIDPEAQLFFQITDIDGNVTTTEPITNPMKLKIDSFSEEFASAILSLKLDLNTASNPSGKLTMIGANGAGTIIWSSASQPMGALIDEILEGDNPEPPEGDFIIDGGNA